jgi:hypothetical protein
MGNDDNDSINDRVVGYLLMMIHMMISIDPNDLYDLLVVIDVVTIGYWHVKMLSGAFLLLQRLLVGSHHH